MMDFVFMFLFLAKYSNDDDDTTPVLKGLHWSGYQSDSGSYSRRLFWSSGAAMAGSYQPS